MFFVLQTANVAADAKNCVYPNRAEITSGDALKAAVHFDHVCGEFKKNYRNISNFLKSNVIVMDCDNDHSEDPDDWITLEKLEELFEEIDYVAVPSRNHLKEKDGKTARPKFHVYFPIEETEDADYYAAVKRAIQKAFPFFDDNAMDAARFIFGSDPDEVVWHEGWMSIEEEVAAEPEEEAESGSNYTGSVILQGSRNKTLSHFAGRALKRFGETDKAKQVFLDEAAKCDPPLEDEELKTIWYSALKFFRNKVKTQPDYVQPDEYNADFQVGSLKPEDYSDIGQAKMLTKEYGEELRYSDATDYLRYDGDAWIEDKQLAVGAMEEFLDLQLADAQEYVENAVKALKAAGVGTWAGKPFELIDWQEQIIRDVFGTMKPNGYRQFNTAYIEIPKKQGKSELAAAVALLLCCGDGEERAEVYGCAADRQQASIVFEVAADMVRMCPALNKRVKILASQKRIIYQPTNSFYQVLSAEAYSKHGFNIHGVVFDELHTQPNRKLFDVMTKGSGDARMQPLYFLITTAGTDTNSICYETHQKAKDILAGRKIDATFYPVIYGADEADDWTDPKVWKKANPSLDITVGIDKVKAACESAKQNPGEENSFRQLRLNQWVKQAVRWMPMEKWDACAFKVDAEELEGRVCYGGLDLSSTTDITAFVLVFPPLDEEDKFCIMPYFWIPEETLDLRVKRDHVPYDVWERQGFLETTEGNVVHYGFIEKFIERLGERYNIREIAFDRWGAVQMVQNLEGMGFTVVPFGQGFKDMSPPTKELMKLTLEKKLAHGGHPVLRWMMDNIYIRTDPAGNIKADKEKSTEKIDGAVATIMGLDRVIRCGNESRESVYDSRGLIVF